MKNKNLKIGFTIILSFAVCSLKAQTLQQKVQKDIDERKKHADAIHLKASEQQIQQKAEKINGTTFPQNTGAGTTIQPGVPVVPQEKKNEIKTPAKKNSEK